MRFLAESGIHLKIVILLGFPLLCQSARICVFSVVGFLNYRSGYDTLLESLVDKGHNVTVFSTLPLNVAQEYKSSIRYISPKAVSNHLDSFFTHISPLEWRGRGKQQVIWDMLPILTLDLCHLILRNEETHKWLQETENYDLFIVDSAWNECGIAIASVFQAKLILFSVHSNLLTWNLDSFGANSEVSWIPDVQYDTSTPPSFYTYFLRKTQATFRSLRWYIYRNSFTFYQVRKFCRKLLKLPDFPSVRELEQNSSLVLVNSHFSEEYARSLPPVFVSVGGVHIRTKDNTGFRNSMKSSVFQKVTNFVGNSSSGFILVNIGCSKDLSRKLSQNTLQIILNGMQRLEQALKFVFVWQNKGMLTTSLPLPRSVLVLNECSNDMVALLAHPKIKGLVSLGDLLDVQEAIFHAVPLILLPVAFEQDANAERVQRLGRGIRLEITSVTEMDLVDAVTNLVSNSMYKNNMKVASSAFRDRPTKLSAVESAVWWIEYTLRTPDMSALKPLSIHQTWFSRRCLDVWFAIFFVCFLCLLVLISALLVSYNLKDKLNRRAGGRKGKKD